MIKKQFEYFHPKFLIFSTEHHSTFTSIAEFESPISWLMKLGCCWLPSNQICSKLQIYK